LLGCFSARTPELTLVELADATGLDKATALRLLRGLERLNFIERSSDDPRYRLGLKALELATAYHSSHLLIQIAEPLLQHLAQRCGQTSELGVIDRGDVVVLAVAYPLRSLRRHVALGERYPAHCTSLGKALLADLPLDELDRFLAVFPPAAVSSKTLTDVCQIKEQLARVRAQGYAADNEETIAGVGCIAAPIRNHTGRVVAALNVSGPAAEFDGSTRASYIEGVGAAAATVSVRLGYSA
jgi:DNA-binding IclR family transcriptional regulator